MLTIFQLLIIMCLQLSFFWIVMRWQTCVVTGHCVLTGPLLWLCTVKSGQKSRSAMARSRDSASGRAPSSSSSSSVWKGRTYMYDYMYVWWLDPDELTLSSRIIWNILNGQIKKEFMSWRKWLSTADIFCSLQLEWGNQFSWSTERRICTHEKNKLVSMYWSE